MLFSEKLKNQQYHNNLMCNRNQSHSLVYILLGMKAFSSSLIGSLCDLYSLNSQIIVYSIAFHKYTPIMHINNLKIYETSLRHFFFLTI